MEKKEKLESSFTKCDNCGSGMIFDPRSQKLKCQHCDTKKDFEKSKEYVKHNKEDKPKDIVGYEEWRNENKILKCETCGAEIILNSLEYSGKCPYCGSSYVSETKKLPTFVPDAIIPFKFDEKEAGERFVENVKKKFFVSSAFKKAIPANKITGIYIPTFSFDAKTASNYYGKLAKCEQYRSHDGSLNTIENVFRIDGEKKLTHLDVLVETSSKITQTQLNGILPYNVKQAYKFDENFIRGYVVEHFDSAFEECYKEAKQTMEKTIRHEILRNYSYDRVISLNVSTKYSDEKYAYRLVPLYQFEYSYKNKPYMTQMNGQTGKIGGKLPISSAKVFLVVFVVLLFLAGVTALSIFVN